MDAMDAIGANEAHAPLSDEQLQRLAVYFNAFGGMTQAAWAELADRRVQLHISLYSDDLTALYPLAPEQRRDAVAAWLAGMFARINAAVPLQEMKQSKFGLPYQLFDCAILASDFLRLLDLRASLPGRFHIEVRAVEGLAPTEQQRKPRRRERAKREWYAVHARFAIQVEGDIEGMQTYEDRIVLLQADTFADAERRFHTSPEVVNYNRPYLNSDYQLVRWQFERILDIYETSISHDGFRPGGVEVYSSLRRRHLRPEYIWRGEGLSAPAPGDEGAQP